MKRSAPLRRKTPLAQPGDRQRANGIGTPRRRAVSPATPAQRAKVKASDRCAAEGSAGCGGPLALQPAHLIDRSLTTVGQDDPRAVVPLCARHHRMYDDERLDLSPYLEPMYREEIAFAVERVGLFPALRRITNLHWRPVDV
ncbi:MAG TPA: hypothetical protein VFG23_08450 [Polyangia bacterium]|nr:hypothetical protein [Polyangia bacterium]